MRGMSTPSRNAEASVSRADHVRDSGASVKPRLIVEPAVGPLKQLFRFVTLRDAAL
jgi:hypothetical protein